MVSALAQVDDVRALGILVNLLEHDRGRRTLNDFSPRIEPHLIRLLRRIEPKDMPVLQGLNERQRRCLYGELRGGNITMVLAILHALGQAGDSTTIGYVEPLAQGTGLATRPRAHPAGSAAMSIGAPGAQRTSRSRTKRVPGFRSVSL